MASPTDPALFALDAARTALRDADEGLRTLTVQVLALADRIEWASPAAAAFRQALADWRTDFAAPAQLIDDLDHELSLTRAVLLVGGDGTR